MILQFLLLVLAHALVIIFIPISEPLLPKILFLSSMVAWVLFVVLTDQLNENEQHNRIKGLKDSNEYLKKIFSIATKRNEELFDEIQKLKQEKSNAII